MRMLVFAAAVSSCASAALADDRITQWPHAGDLYFDGTGYADSVFYTHNAYGNWQTNTSWSDPGLEIDVNLVDQALFTECTSWSDVPKFYDDCVTAGVTETGSARSFGIGTYDGRLLRPDVDYTARWYFSGGSGSRASVTVTWQEVWKDFCAFEDPWCMNSIAGGRFMSLVWNYGTSSYNSWHDPHL